MFKTLLSTLTIFSIIQTNIAQAYNPAVYETCLRRELVSVKEGGCKVMAEIQLQYKRNSFEAAQEYFCNLQIGQRVEDELTMISEHSENVNSNLIDTKNGLSLGDRNRIRISDLMSKMMNINVQAKVSDAGCSLKALPIPYNR